MAYAHDLRTPVDPLHLVQPGICDRCGFKYPLDSGLPFQFDWRGNSIQNLHIRVCHDRCLDEPAEILRPILIEGPEGVGLPDPRPYLYAQQMASTGPELPFAPSNPMLPVVEPIEGAPIDGLAPQTYQKGQLGI